VKQLFINNKQKRIASCLIFLSFSSGRYEKAVVERHLIIKEESDLIRQTLYGKYGNKYRFWLSSE